MQSLYTIGHSNQSQEDFLKVLRTHQVNIIVDVRSVPVSSYAPQFNQECLHRLLHGEGIDYVYLGNELGARRTDSLNDAGQVDFELALKTKRFKEGVMQVNDLLKQGHRIALMCSEANPLCCHRFALLARYFHEQGIDIQHILLGGSLRTQVDLEKDMIFKYLRSRKYHLAEIDQLMGTYTAEEQRRDAYRLKNLEIGYRPSLTPSEID